MALTDLDGMTSAEQLTRLRARAGPMLKDAAGLFEGVLRPELKEAGIEVQDYALLSKPQQRALRAYFDRDVFPVLTPLALGPGHPFPHISNLSLNLAVVVRDPDLGERFARMKVPGVLPRFVPLPPEEGGQARRFVWLEQVIAANMESLFPDLMRGKLDLAFLRPEPQMPDLVYKVVMREPLVLVLPSDHRLAAQEVIAIQDVAEETFIGMSKTAPSLKLIIDEYLNRAGVESRAAHEIDNLGMAIALVASTRGVTLLPAYARNFLPWSVISRPLKGEAPTIDLVIGYNKANTSPILKLFLSRTDDLISRVANKVRTDTTTNEARHRQ